MYYLGIDAGGTHTRFVMMNEKGEAIDRYNMESIHFMRVGFDGITNHLNNAKEHFENLGYDFNNIEIVMGMGGFGESKEIQNSILTAVHKVFEKITVMNDAKFAMISALNNQDGIYLISGTGSIAFGIKDQKELRMGGFGYLLGDEGSAFWIGKKILAAFTKEADQRHPRTELYDLIMNSFELESPYDLIKIANEEEDYRGWVAQLSSLVSSIDHVDKIRHIYKEAGKELADLVNGFKASDKTPVALGGGVLIHNNIVKESLEKHLDEQYYIVENSNDVEYAAYLLRSDHNEI